MPSTLITRGFQTLKRRTPLGWIQLNHHKGRLLVALSGIAFADVLMFMQLGFQAALYDSTTRLSRSLTADVVFISPKARNLQNLSTFSRRRLYQAMDIPGVQSVDAMYVNSLTWQNPQTHRQTTIQLIGINPVHPTFTLPEVNQQLNKLRIPDTVLFDRLARGDYKKAIAQIDQGKAITTEAEARTMTIAGLFNLGASFGADANVITSDQTFLRFFPRRAAASVSLGLIYLKTGANPHQVAHAIQMHLADDIKVFTREQFIQFEEAYWRKTSPIGFIFGLGTSMAFVVGVVIVYQILSTDVNSHIKEYATLKAMGYRNCYLLFVVFEQALILSLLGFIPGFLLSLGLYQLTARATSLLIFMTMTRAWLVLLLTIFMCLISGAIATRNLQSADPADMF